MIQITEFTRISKVNNYFIIEDKAEGSDEWKVLAKVKDTCPMYFGAQRFVDILAKLIGSDSE